MLCFAVVEAFCRFGNFFDRLKCVNNICFTLLKIALKPTQIPQNLSMLDRKALKYLFKNV